MREKERRITVNLSALQRQDLQRLATHEHAAEAVIDARLIEDEVPETRIWEGEGLEVLGFKLEKREIEVLMHAAASSASNSRAELAAREESPPAAGRHLR